MLPPLLNLLKQPLGLVTGGGLVGQHHLFMTHVNNLVEP